MKMLNRHTVIIAAIVLTSALASATLATPTFAQKNNGDFAQSVEANNKGGGLCTDLLGYFKKWTKKMNEAKTSDEKAWARNAANGHLGTAWAEGCAWVDGV